MTKTRIWTLISLLIIIPVGFYSKFYRGPGANWVNNSLGGVFYEIFWCLLILLIADILRKPDPLKKTGYYREPLIAAAVLIMTCILEFLQLWHPPVLESLRSSFIGRTVLGTTFAWSDFPYYFLGTGIGWIWMRLCRVGFYPTNSAVAL
jgi:hypothetical protein